MAGAGAEPPFTLGIEEEYFLVERDSRDLARELPPGLLDACKTLDPSLA